MEEKNKLGNNSGENLISQDPLEYLMFIYFFGGVKNMIGKLENTVCMTMAPQRALHPGP